MRTFKFFQRRSSSGGFLLLGPTKSPGCVWVFISLLVFSVVTPGWDSFDHVIPGILISKAYAQFGAGRSGGSLLHGTRSRRGSRSRSTEPREPLPDSEPEPAPQQPPPPQRPAPPPPPQQPAVQQVPQGQPQQVSVPVRPQQPRVRAVKPVPRGKGTVAPGGKGAAPQTPETTTGIPPKGELILRIVPLEQKADVGEKFFAHVWLDNPEKKPFDVVSFALSYDPNLLRFIDAPGGEEGIPNSYDGSEKIRETFDLIRDPRQDPFYLNRADTENGFIYYRARCASGEVCTNEGFLLSMRFEALVPIDRSGLRFVFADWSDELAPPVQSDQSWNWPSVMTFIGLTPQAPGSHGEWKDLLGDPKTKDDGVISANLTVRGTDPDEVLEKLTAVPEGRTETRLLLEPPLQAVQAGRTFDMNIVLENPKRIPWDRVRIDISFDPRYLQAEDHDAGNWLTRGTNILDGPYHDRFPFDFFWDNQVRNQAGRILYDCGVLGKELRAGGVLATIRFRAVEEVPETFVRFNMAKRKESRKGTALLLRRNDILGNTEDSQDGALGASVVIVPSRDLISVAGEGPVAISPK